MDEDKSLGVTPSGSGSPLSPSGTTAIPNAEDALEKWKRTLWELIDCYRLKHDWPQSCRDSIKHHLTQIPERPWRMKQVEWSEYKPGARIGFDKEG